MIVRLAGAAIIMVTLFAGCGGSEADPANPDLATGQLAGMSLDTAALTPISTVCRPDGRMPVDGRESPYDSTLVRLNGEEAKVCYGRPSMRGREILGAMLPYDTIWRTGANEPTIIHLPFAAEIAGMRVEPGSYSIYSVPGVQQWTVIVNRSTSQWGIEAQYTDAIRAQEVGRAPVASEPIVEPVDTFTITSEETAPTAANLVLEWENIRVRIPIERI